MVQSVVIWACVRAKLRPAQVERILHVVCLLFRYSSAFPIQLEKLVDKLLSMTRTPLSSSLVQRVSIGLRWVGGQNLALTALRVNVWRLRQIGSFVEFVFHDAHVVFKLFSTLNQDRILDEAFTALL